MRTTVFFRVLSSLTLLLAGWTLTASHTTAQTGLTSVRVTLPGVVEAVKVQGNTAYVGLTDGFAILDITHPLQPMVRSVVQDGHGGMKLAVGDGYILRDLDVFDVSNPYRPVKLSRIPGEIGVADMAVHGDYGFIANPDDRNLMVVDLRVRTTPVIVARLEDRGELSAVEVIEDAATGRVYVYLGSLVNPAFRVGGGLRVIDVTDPTDPQEVWPCNNPDPCLAPGDITDIALRDGFAYISLREFNGRTWDVLEIWDIAEPRWPRFIKTYETEEGSAWFIAVDGSRVYLGQTDELDRSKPWYLRVLDVRDKQAIRSVGEYEIGGGEMPWWPAPLAAGKGCVFVPAREMGLRILCETSIIPTSVWLPRLATPVR